MNDLRRPLHGLVLALGLGLPTAAAAQGGAPMVSPNGDAPAAPADDGGDVSGPPPPAYSTAPSASAPAPANGAAGQGAGQAGQGPQGPLAADGGAGGYYHNDDYAEGIDLDPGMGGGGGGGGGPVPAVHVVQRGDTLWDLCTTYFNSPWEWPRVWSYNPEITNPHWIYPGNQVRMRVGGDGGGLAGPGGPAGGGAGPGGPGGARPLSAAAFNPDEVSLRHVAFVDLEDLKYAGKIDGSPEEKSLLARGDEAYLSYRAGEPPKAGARLSVYQKARDVKHPDTGKVVGAYVNVVGEVEVMSVKQGKRARSMITDSIDVIERGNLVGPLRQRFAKVEATEAKADAQATILEVLGSDQLIGARQVVLIDKGKADGVAVGNRLYAVRRGDAYAAIMGPKTNVGKDDRRYPARALGELLVIDVGKRTSLAVVTVAVQELGIGDHVVLSRAIN